MILYKPVNPNCYALQKYKANIMLNCIVLNFCTSHILTLGLFSLDH